MRGGPLLNKEESTVSVKIQVLFYSMYGHIYRMAEAVVKGAREVEGAEVSLYQVAELVAEEALERIGAKAARSAFGHVPIATPGQLAEADAIIFDTPTRFGNMCAQMRNFLDQTGPLWLGKEDLHALQVSARGGELFCHDGGERVQIASVVAK